MCIGVQYLLTSLLDDLLQHDDSVNTTTQFTLTVINSIRRTSSAAAPLALLRVPCASALALWNELILRIELKRRIELHRRMTYIYIYIYIYIWPHGGTKKQ